MTLGKIGRDLRELEDRFTEFQSEREWKGDERRSDGAAFSDKQTERIKALIDERAEVHAGRVFFRVILWSIGSVAALALSLTFAYLRLH